MFTLTGLGAGPVHTSYSSKRYIYILVILSHVVDAERSTLSLTLLHIKKLFCFLAALPFFNAKHSLSTLGTLSLSIVSSLLHCRDAAAAVSLTGYISRCA